MASTNGAPIIVKKVRKVSGDAHHGGAWKVAYADFVTAMMAFFLLMWLLNATTENQRKGLADYFDPSIPLARISGGGSAMLSGDSVMVEGNRSGSDRPSPGAGPAEGDVPEAAAAPDAAAAAAFDATYAAEQARLEALSEQIRAAVDEAGGSAGAHFALRLTPEGLVIEIVDTASEPLFESGSTAATPRLDALVSMVAPLLATVRNRVAVAGHTDATPYAGRPGGNWALSAERAATALTLMQAAGLSGDRVARVSGRAATEPLADDPYAPVNRRISVILLRHDPR